MPNLHVLEWMSKAQVDVAMDVGGAAQRYANDIEGHTALVAALAKEDAVALIVMEATGGYEAGLACALQAAGLPVAVINP